MDLRSKDAIESSKQHDIKIGNILIAEFMGLETPFNEISDATLYTYKGIEEASAITFVVDVELHEMRYHLSWDWLMPVINKIRSMDSTYEVEEVGKYDWDNEISHYEFDLELTYESVIKFIKEYNNEE